MPRATPKFNNLTQKKDERRDMPTNKDIEDALIACKGIYVAAAKWLKRERDKSITRQTLSKRIAASKHLREVCDEVVEQTLDWAESKLLELMAAGDKTAILFYLKCKGKNRGYIERQELTGKDGAVLTGDKLEPVEVNIRIIDPAGKVKRLED